MSPILRFGAFLACAAAVWSAPPPPVVVVVNENSAASKEIASYYRARRNIPPSNVCAIRTADAETVARDVYEREIARPLANCLRARGLAESTLYLVATAGVPLRVQGAPGMGGDLASVDSELALLYGAIKGHRYPPEGSIPNPFFGKRDAPFRHPDFPIYLVTRLAAYDVAGAKALVDRALAAKNAGVFAIDCKSEEDASGDAWLRDAAIRLPADRLAFEGTEKPLERQRGVIAYASWGSNDPARKTRSLGFEWLPGAIVAEFVSTNARTFREPPPGWNIGSWAKDKRRLWFAGSPQTLIGDYLREGATGAAGNVDEPYLGLTVRPDLLLPAYHSGRNLAESFYLATPALSWRNVVIGDPLCALGPPRR